MPLADTLLRLGSRLGLYQPKWTSQIIVEVNRSLCLDFGLTGVQLERRESEMRSNLPYAWVEGYEDLIFSMTNHPKDRHVLAAAVRCEAKAIVTHNLKDFPRSALDQHAIIALGPSEFLREMYYLNPQFVSKTLHLQAASINQPIDYILDRLNVNAPGFVSFLRSKRFSES